MAQDQLDRTAELMTDADITDVSMSVSKILVATDGSATAVEATKVGISLAKCFNAEVIALFVGPGNVEDPMQYIEQEQLEGVHHTAAGLKIAAQLGEKNGIKVTAAIAQGSVAHEVLEACKANDVNMIVIGSEGRTGFKRVALGSVAEAVLRDAHVPVMVVRHCSTEFCITPQA
ncbi:MAG: universal stress protein [Coriobacteriales bacterium]|nr:universal stress protein [Coriobacteriales bacterium]